MECSMTRPCENCPFRRGGIKLRNIERAQQVASAENFPCHKTVNYGEEGDGRTTERSRVCAGSLIFHEKTNTPTQMMRIAERLGCYDPSRLDRTLDDQIIDVPSEMVGGAFAPIQEELLDEPESCAIVDGNCENPAGILYGTEVDHIEPKTRTMCSECWNPVCGACSTIIASRRICNDCAEDLNRVTGGDDEL